MAPQTDGNRWRKLRSSSPADKQPRAFRHWLADAPAAYLLPAPVLVRFAFAMVYPRVETIWLSVWDSLLFLRTQIPLPMVFVQISGMYDANRDLCAVAAIVITIVPLIVVQRQFAGGSRSTSASKE